MQGRIAPLCGVAFVVLIVVSFAVGGETPDGDASAHKAVKFYTDHDSQQIVAAIALAWATIFFLFWTGTLRAALRRGEGDTGGLSAIAFGGSVLVAVGMSIFGALAFTLADLADKISPTAVQTLNAMNSDLFLPLAIGVAVFMIAAGLAVARTAILPRWLGWVAVVIGLAAATPVGFFAVIAMFVWTLVASILLTIRAGRTAAAAPAAPAT